MTFEERLTRLEDIEAIRFLQAKYQRCLDTRDFTELEDCFAEDVVSSYDNGSMSYSGREAVLGFLREAMTLKMPSSHLIHGGEIEIKSTSTASAKWYLEDYLLHQKFKLKLHGAAIYDIDYEKSPDGHWRIKTIGYKRCYQYFEFRGLINQITLGKTTFLDQLRKKEKKKSCTCG